MDLIEIEERDGVKTVNARELWDFLDVKRDFSTWIKNRIEQYGFMEGVDFTTTKSIPQNGGTVINYHLSLDMAKELSMVERNDKGRQARQYFIECEKKSKGANLSPAELILQQAQRLVDHEKALTKMNSRIDLIEAKQQTIQTNYYTVSGYCSLRGIKLTSFMASAYGRKCAKFSKEFDYMIDKAYDAKYGTVNSYHLDVLSENIP